MKKDDAKESKDTKEKKKVSKQEDVAVDKRLRIRNIIRMGETDLDGSKTIERAITNVKGVSFSYAHAVLDVFGIRGKKVADLSEQELSRLEDIIINPLKHGIPVWMVNRRNDPDTGLNEHLIASKMDLTQKADINREKRLKSYRGIRHILGQPVRGQRTRSSFRGGKVVGVKRVKATPATAAKGGSKEKERGGKK